MSNKNLEIERNKKAVLLVEDQLISQKNVKQILQNLNCDVDVVSTGREAIQKYQENEYDLVFIDLGLPDVDGYTVTQSVRQIEKETQRTRAPIFALTAHMDLTNQELLQMAGLTQAIQKPLTEKSAQNILLQCEQGITTDIED